MDTDHVTLGDLRALVEARESRDEMWERWKIHGQRLDAHVQRLNVLEKRTAAFDATDWGVRLNRLVNVEQRLDELERKVNTLCMRLDEVDGRTRQNLCMIAGLNRAMWPECDPSLIHRIESLEVRLNEAKVEDRPSVAAGLESEEAIRMRGPLPLPSTPAGRVHAAMEAYEAGAQTERARIVELLRDKARRYREDANRCEAAGDAANANTYGVQAITTTVLADRLQSSLEPL